MFVRRRTEVANEDEDNDDTEFAPGKKIKLENAAHSAGNLAWMIWLLYYMHALLAPLHYRISEVKYLC